MSGRHVVYGFLQPFCESILPSHELVLLHYQSDPPPKSLRQTGMVLVPVAERFRHWAKRTAWETLRIPKLIRDLGIDVALTVSGHLMPRCPVPQAVLCQNPWCYRPNAHQSIQDRIKAKLQRLGYGRAFKHADLMIYISNHLRSLYQSDNRSAHERNQAVAYVGLDSDTFKIASTYQSLQRKPYSVLAVSAMANWKGIHTLVDAISLVRGRNIPATLRLVGPWPDPAYENRIRSQIARLHLNDAVKILGRISDEDLHREYATSQVFALPSQCESFGIPAAEAMVFGTPVVSTDCCAISEICESAGKFGPAENPNWTADAIEQLLVDRHLWNHLSTAARTRASELTWDRCVQPLLQIESLAS
ncbi:glycosyltransferase family 4 protein [Stieleria sp. JC731]|uniref:glycosyltransferase family 4 protein n=1 Tax=Pirellulaceae TaxID=2691357 RepID=UPI001E4FDC2C|nr:glycosyltransferase family 4 protein [Stieleria sp. JC731]MCC9601241.1 glycosyltransferase family 4 protein [Stieleria sp. JC731]